MMVVVVMEVMVRKYRDVDVFLVTVIRHTLGFLLSLFRHLRENRKTYWILITIDHNQKPLFLTVCLELDVANRGGLTILTHYRYLCFLFLCM